MPRTIGLHRRTNPTAAKYDGVSLAVGHPYSFCSVLSCPFPPGQQEAGTTDSVAESFGLRTSDFAKALPDASRALTGAQAVRLRSLHRDAPAVTRSLPSEARSSSYNPFVLFFRFSFPLSHINATETSLWSRAFCSAVAPSWCPCCEEVLAICSSLVELPPFLWLHQLFSSRPAFRHKLRGCIPFAVTFPLDL